MDYESQNWLAAEQEGAPGGHRTISVSGEVQIRASNEVPKLVRAAPGINPKTLILNLEVTTDGEGSHVQEWVDVDFEERVSHHQFTEVLIQGKTQAVVKVDEEISLT